MQSQKQNIAFDKVPVNPDWCFKNVRSVEQWTHGYHRYPAKFLPNLVKKLIEEYTNENDLVADLFAGCGTTLVEVKVTAEKEVTITPDKENTYEYLKQVSPYVPMVDQYISINLPTI